MRGSMLGAWPDWRHKPVKAGERGTYGPWQIQKLPVPDDRIDRTVDGIEHPLRRGERSTEGEHPAVQFLHAQHLMKPVPPGVGHGLQDPPVTLVKAENKDVLAYGGGCPGVVPRRHRRTRTRAPLP